ncbi:regulatory protein GntR HTH [Actinobacteria bacterium OK074]|nr:regulatory protein GntR HTH [Actinobacteria bacterium OK074]
MQADIKRVEALLCERLADGTYPVRSWFPAHTALVAELGATLHVILHVTRRLVSAGLIGTKLSVGSYVIDPDDPAALPATPSPKAARAERWKKELRALPAVTSAERLTNDEAARFSTAVRRALHRGATVHDIAAFTGRSIWTVRRAADAFPAPSPAADPTAAT